MGGRNIVDTGDHSLSVTDAAPGRVLRIRAVHGAGPPHMTRVDGAAPLDFLGVLSASFSDGVYMVQCIIDA